MSKKLNDEIINEIFGKRRKFYSVVEGSCFVDTLTEFTFFLGDELILLKSIDFDNQRIILERI